MSTITYGSRPKFTLNWSNTAASYVIITYTGNAIVGTGTTRTSGAQTGSSWTSGDLSLNATYTFTLTPYNQAGIAGTARTMSVDTTPARGGSLSVGTSTTSGTQISWSAATAAGSNISYVRIYRQITSPYTGSVEDICAGTYISSSPYYDNDISGNATYTYTVYPYDSNYGELSSAGQTFFVSTTAAAARDLSAVFYDTSSIKISFTLPKNAYSSSYYYQLNAVYSGTTTSISGETSPLWVSGLIEDTSYSCYIDTYLDGILAESSITTKFYTSSSSSSVIKTNLKMWLDAYYSTYFTYDTNGYISSWTDRMSNYTTTYVPINSKYISYSGKAVDISSNGYFTTTYPGCFNTETIIFVFSYTKVQESMLFYTSNTSSRRIWINSGSSGDKSNFVAINGGTGPTFNDVFTSKNTRYYFAYAASGNSFNIYLNGSKINQGTTTGVNTAGYTYIAGAQWPPTVKFNEILFYNSQLSASDITTMYNYLYNKWNGVSI